MTEMKRIAGLFTGLFDGNPWLQVTLMDTLEAIGAAGAAAHTVPGVHSIWAIAQHVAAWRENVLQRVEGAILTTPEHNYFEPVADTSDAAWEGLLSRLRATQEDWLALLARFNEEAFTTVYPPNGFNYYEHMHGILQHDAYHLGQIVLLAKTLRREP